MDAFAYQDDVLHAEDVRLDQVAEQYGTPCFVYSAGTMTGQVRKLQQAFGDQPHRIYYSVKANSNLAVLQHLAAQGCGFDIVSGGELVRVQAAGVDPGQVIFSGVGKSEAEIRQALQASIAAFHVESFSELERIDCIAQEMDLIAPIALRLNPEIGVETHPHIATGGRGSKFGIPISEAREVYREAATRPGLRVCGAACHIGSQIIDTAPIAQALGELVRLSDQLQDDGITLEYLDVGGGLGICYQDEQPPSVRDYVATLCRQVGDRPQTLVCEPGRFVVGNAGVLLTRVEYIKQTGGRCFVVVDAAMTELMRPALYGAWHAIHPVQRHAERKQQACDVVGPVCETADCLGRSRPLSAKEGEVLAIYSAGAYAASMGSCYNSRVAVAEVMVEGGRCDLVRARGKVAQIHAGERLR